MTKTEIELRVLSACIGSRCSSCPFCVGKTYICKQGTDEEKLAILERINNPISEDDLFEFIMNN